MTLPSDLAAFVLSLLPQYCFSSQVFSSPPSQPYYWFSSCSSSPPIFCHAAVTPCAQLTLPLRPQCHLPRYLQGLTSVFPSSAHGLGDRFWWNHCVHALSLVIYSFSFNVTTLGSNKLNMMQIWWEVLFLQYIIQHWDLGVENRRGMLTSSCGIVLLRSLNTRVKKLVPCLHGSMPLWKSFQAVVLAYKLYPCEQRKCC